MKSFELRKTAPARGALAPVQPDNGSRSRNHYVLVLSPESYNAATGFCLVCPLSRVIKKLPFEEPITCAGQEYVVLSDQIQAVRWAPRMGRTVDVASNEALARIGAHISLLLPDSAL